MKQKFIVCTKNLEWIECTTNGSSIGSKIRKIKNRGYKRSFIDVYKQIPYPYWNNGEDTHKHKER